MIETDNVRIVQEFIHTRNPAFIADDIIFHDYSKPEPVQGRQAVQELINSYYRDAFTDTTVEMRNIIANGNSVTLEFTFHGVHTGSVAGQPPTGKRLELPMCCVCDVEDGVIRRFRFYYDTGLVQRQLGWLPTPENETMNIGHDDA